MTVTRPTTATPQSHIKSTSKSQQPSSSVKQLINTIESHNNTMSNNTIINDDSNVTVCVRVRPLNTVELNSSQSIAFNINQNTITPSVTVESTKKSTQQYTYDCIFDQHITNEDIYKRLGSSVIQRVLAGYHSCIFAYGMYLLQYNIHIKSK